MPKTNEILLKLEYFQYTTSLDLNMGYYQSNLAKMQVIYVISFSLGEKNCYKRLTTRVAHSPDIFQQKMNDLFHGFGFIHAYMDKFLISTKGNLEDHVQKL